jgi:undecaprenyl-diphosphatase
VVRGRPDEYLTDVVHRGAPAHGLGFVSGHAAVVTALLVVAWPWLTRPARIVCAVLAVFVCMARVYVSAHLPLDVVGGAALGLAVGAAVRLLLGRPG